MSRRIRELQRIARLPLPGEAGSGLVLGVAKDDDGAVVGRQNLANQLQQALLQRLQVANRINRVGYLEQRVQVASHAANVGAKSAQRWIGLQLGGGKQVDRILLLAELHDMGNQLFVFGNQEDELAISGADGIAMAQKFAAHRNTIHECAVVAVEVDQVEGRISFTDGEVPARHRAIMQTQVVGGITPDGELHSGQPDDGSFRRARNHDDSRVQDQFPPGC